MSQNENVILLTQYANINIMIIINGKEEEDDDKSNRFLRI